MVFSLRWAGGLGIECRKVCWGERPWASLTTAWGQVRVDGLPISSLRVASVGTSGRSNGRCPMVMTRPRHHWQKDARVAWPHANMGGRMGMVWNKIVAERPQIWFACHCGLAFHQLTELVNHHEDRHTLPALAAYVPARFQQQARTT